ncbi:MAG: GNAT family N-acetyltransferase [Anaerolineae bacterium]|nr:GNAT family N-acetyltransferase [Anaerolineae bacterium]
MSANNLSLVTPRLILRPFDPSDAKPLHSILNQEKILQYFPGPSSPSLDRVEALIQRQLAHWETHGFGWWAVQPRDHPELVGWNGLQYLPETDEVEIGYLLSRPFWGRGLATEGARAGMHFGFETLGLQTIIGIVHPENTASAHVLEKLGMRCTGEAVYFEMDVLRYEVGREAWRMGESANGREIEQAKRRAGGR